MRTLILLAIARGVSASSCLALTAVFDGTLSGGNPKGVELYALCDVLDASGYSVVNFNNGGTSASGTTNLSPVEIKQGSYYHVTTNLPSFETFFGFNASQAGNNFVNGDDVIELQLNSVTVDVYGVKGVDGTGESWEYLDGWAYRQSNTSLDGSTFVASHWTFGGVGAFEGHSTNADSAPNSMPIRSFSMLPSAPDPPGPPSMPPSMPPTCSNLTFVQSVATAGTFGDEFLVCAWVTRVVYNGFFVQEDDKGPQAAIFVYTGSAPQGLASGDAVRVVGTLGQYQGQRQLSSPVTIKTGEPPRFFSPIELTLPVKSLSMLDSLQSQLVSIKTSRHDSLVVSEYYNLDRYGEFVACVAPAAVGRLYQYTAENTPSATGYSKHLEDLRTRCVYIDDDQSTQNPDPVLLGSVYPATSTADNLRGGSHVLTLVGPLYKYFGNYYRVQPATASDLVLDKSPNLRPPIPMLNTVGDVRIASVNLLNYWVTVGTSSSLRGADSQLEFDRQAAKTVLALTTIDADVYGLVELENVLGNLAAIDLVGRLNAANPSRTYLAVSVEAAYDMIGGDVIKVDIVFDSKKLQLLGASILEDTLVPAQVALSEEGIIFDGRSRVPLAASLRHLQSGHDLTLVVNHFKSKGGSGPGQDADQADGAGNFNHVRTLSSQALLDWLDTTPTGFSTENIIIMGDLNAYAMETPITSLTDAGFRSVSTDYSYLFDGQFGSLDYIFVAKKMKVRRAVTWHINADEPDLIDYNLDYGRNSSIFDGTVPYRFSDHDPVVVELDLKRNWFSRIFCWCV